MGFLCRENQVVTCNSLQDKLNKEKENLQGLLKSVDGDYLCIANQLVERLRQYSFLIKSYRQFIGKTTNGFEDILTKHLSKSNSLGNIHQGHSNLDTIKSELLKTLTDSKNEIASSRENALKKDVIDYLGKFNIFFLTKFQQLKSNYSPVSCQPASFAQR
jgi:hypothetical protein